MFREGRVNKGKKGHSTQHRHRGIPRIKRKRKHSTEQKTTHKQKETREIKTQHRKGTGGAHTPTHTHTHVVYSSSHVPYRLVGENGERDGCVAVQ